MQVRLVGVTESGGHVHDRARRSMGLGSGSAGSDEPIAVMTGTLMTVVGSSLRH